ncbi:MAG TPA: sigma-70 family RNA polymerase sigma factor [Herpetosiphonaceae bacterium]|nr:sigma-70 family RNA polymerase sigma factor [Herpetosiphonaceae bacterium]
MEWKLQPTEEEIAALLAVDLAGHFESVVVIFQDRLFSFALRLTGNRQDAEEIAQDAFVRAYRSLVGYEPERIRALRLRPWLYQITLNVVRNRVRGKRLQQVDLDERGPVSAIADAEETGPEAATLRSELARELAALVAALPWRYRAPVILRHVEGLGYGEAAGVLGQPVGTVKANVHRGVRLLRDALAQQLIENR